MLSDTESSPFSSLFVVICSSFGRNLITCFNPTELKGSCFAFSNRLGFVWISLCFCISSLNGKILFKKPAWVRPLYICMLVFMLIFCKSCLLNVFDSWYHIYLHWSIYHHIRLILGYLNYLLALSKFASDNLLLNLDMDFDLIICNVWIYWLN